MTLRVDPISVIGLLFLAYLSFQTMWDHYGKETKQESVYHQQQSDTEIPQVYERIQVSEEVQQDSQPEPLYTELKLSDIYSVSLFACHVPQRSAKILMFNQMTLHGQTIHMMRLDRNYDGGIDMALIFDDRNGQPSTFPHYYVYDLNFDGTPDKAYRDVNGNGVCQEMEEVPVKYVVEGGKGA